MRVERAIASSVPRFAPNQRFDQVYMLNAKEMREALDYAIMEADDE